MTPEPPVLVERQGGITRVHVNVTDLLDDQLILEVAQEIIQAVENDPAPKLVISFAGIKHLSSSVLGVLIKIHGKVRERDGQLRLADINPSLQQVFAITRLNKLFQIHDSTEQAAASFE